MPRHETSRLKLSYGWLRGEDWWGDPVSDNFVLIDMLLNPVILSMTEIEPPQNGITVGDMFIVAAGAIGAWKDHDGELALRAADRWIFAVPTEGVRARLKNPAGWIWFNGETWLGEDKNGEDDPAPLGTRYDIAVSVGYEAEPLEILLVYTMPEAMVLPDGAVGSIGRSVTSPLGILRLAIARNGSPIGTITFTLNSVQATFTVVGDKAFAKGDLLTIQMPETPPDGFENYSATLRFLLTT
jgi:Protein of unknown function (DUF2793)